VLIDYGKWIRASYRAGAFDLIIILFMISYLSGKIIQKNKNSLVILTTGGVGYKVNVESGKWNVKDNISLYTYLKISENSMDLYGFEIVEEKQFFELLLSVKGVGPRSAMNILSVGSIDEIQNAIGRSDVKYLTAVQGMGKKIAERLCVELKSKVESRKSKDGEDLVGDVLVEVVDGLVSMGYNREVARDIVRSLDSVGKSTEDLLREALRGV